MTSSDTLYLRQLLSGQDYARLHPVAGQMANFAYLVGCREAGECLVVDPSWDPRGLVQIAEEDGLRVVGAVATHAHPDHVGGDMFGISVPGLRELIAVADVPVHAHAEDAPRLATLCGLDQARLTQHQDGDLIEVGQQRLQVLHCPGHTPGHLCLLVGDALITGDVLFVGACGRVDLPGADPRRMYASLQRLAQLPGHTVVLPGHDYGPAPRSTIEEERRSNPALQASSAEAWTRDMGGPL